MAIASVVFNVLGASTADSKAVVALADASTAGSDAIVADSIADAALADASTALLDASTADSKAVIADSIADAGILDASTADSKAVIADSIADTAQELAASAIGSEPDAGEYLVTDIKRDSDGSIVIDYDDSVITE